MIVLGLTGSIGMGKSTAAQIMRRLSVPVSDADAIVHKLIGPGGQAVSAIEERFPGSTKGCSVDRKALGERVFNDPDALKALESILHPLVETARDRFLKRNRRYRRRVVALDIPLLFEIEADKYCDATIVVLAPDFVQEFRVLNRPGMTKEKFNNIKKTQMSNYEKCRRATFVVPSGSGRRITLQALTRIVSLSKSGRLLVNKRR